MKKLSSLVLSFIMLLTTPLSAHAAGFTSPIGSSISSEAQEHIISQIRRARIPNAAIAVIQDGETSFILQDVSYDTLFNIASDSKPFTAFGVLLLEDLGLLSVSDPVNQHLPWFEVNYRDIPVPHEDISIYNLLHHTSGITSNENRFPRAALTETNDEFASRLRGMELDFYPSTNRIYGNMNYIILGLLIEAVSGQSYDEFMTQQVLHPLGLYNTFTNEQRAYETGRVVGGHVRTFLQIRPATRDRNSHPANMPTGGIYASIADMARWAEIQLGIVYVPEQFARIVQRSRLQHHDLNTPVAEITNFHAAGWLVDLDAGFIGHGGQATHGYSSMFRMFPQNNTAVIVLSSLRYQSVDQLGMVALEALVSGSFNRVGFELFEIIDMFSTILIVVGIAHIALFVRLAIKVNKRLRSGERIKVNFSLKNIRKFPIISITGLIFYYTFHFIILDTTRASIAANWPISFTVASIAIWIMTLYDLFSWFAKVFIQKDAL